MEIVQSAFSRAAVFLFPFPLLFFPDMLKRRRLVGGGRDRTGWTAIADLGSISATYTPACGGRHYGSQRPLHGFADSQTAVAAENKKVFLIILSAEACKSLLWK